MRAPTLTAGPVILRPWRESDADAYIAGRDEEVFRWTTEPRELAVEQLRAAVTESREAADLYGFAIIDDLEADLPVGNLSVVVRGAVAEVSYWLSPQGRGRGYASAALGAVCTWLEARDDVSRIEALTHPANVKSQDTARRAGFVDSGLRRSDASFSEDGQVVVLVRECH